MQEIAHFCAQMARFPGKLAYKCTILHHFEIPFSQANYHIKSLASNIPTKNQPFRKFAIEK